jgi:homoserine acetyltransferase
MAELKRRLPGPAALVQISSIYGHDAFLKHPHVLAPIISTALGAGEQHA